MDSKNFQSLNKKVLGSGSDPNPPKQISITPYSDPFGFRSDQFWFRQNLDDTGFGTGNATAVLFS